MIHPIFKTNALPMNSDNGVLGYYQSLLDAVTIFLPETDNTTRSHELAHRVSTHYSMEGSAFHEMSELAGLSHSLLWGVFNLANEHQIHIYGNSFKNLSFGKSKLSQVHQNIQVMINKVRDIEKRIDMLWYGVAPLAEMIAIDFTDASQIKSGEWKLWHEGMVFPKDPAIRKRKNRQIQETFIAYPPDYGGYNVTYGSFQNAMKMVWDVYSKIEMDSTRKELLRYCMHITQYSQGSATATISDPIKYILDHAKLAKESPEQWAKKFFTLRTTNHAFMLGLFERYGKLIEELPTSWQEIRYFTRALRTLVLIQMKGTDSYGGGLIPPMPGNEASTMFSSIGFLRLELDQNNQHGTLQVNPHFIYRSYVEKWEFKLADNWWRILLLMESVRVSLKEGTPLACPLKEVATNKWKMPALIDHEPLNCHKNCVIRNWISTTKKNVGFVSKHGVCEV